MPDDTALGHPAAGAGSALTRRSALAAAVFFASGASLVVHILTGATLPAVFGAFLVGGAVLFVQAAAEPASRSRMVSLLRVGAVAGVASTAVYDAARYALMVGFDLHVSPFKALPYFGNALVGAEPHSTASWIAGAAFHVTNGVCFGIGYTVLAGRRHVGWAVAFGLGLEAFMLTLYPRWMQIDALREFTEMSLFGHVAYGLSLGLVTNALLRDRPSGADGTGAADCTELAGDTGAAGDTDGAGGGGDTGGAGGATLGASEAPDAPRAPDAPDVDDTPEASEAAEVPDAPGTPAA